jgi:signal transduction histidine kinase
VPIAWGDRDDPVGTLVTFLLMVVGVYAVGVVVRRQRHHADSATRERDLARQTAREIAASERARIARELHDIVAHGMSVVVLQARGGRRVFDSEPDAARRALDDIEQVASDCLEEMRRLLGILRSGDSAPLAPQPRLLELESLVQQAQSSGASVDLCIEGERRELPPAVELSIYRIAQEALTNSMKHAPGSRARLQVVYGDTAVTVIATDDGPGGAPSSPGHGLIGMRERVDLFGGTFSAGSQSEGGFAVRASLPLEPVP